MAATSASGRPRTPAETVGDEIGGGVDIEGCEVDHLGTPRGRSGLDHRLDVGAVGAADADQQQARRVGAPEQQVDHVEGAVVRPVQVVEDHGERPGLRQRAERLGALAEHA